VDVAALIEASEMFTPADIEYAARKGAQAAFEREVRYQAGTPATTKDYLDAIADTRPSLTEQARLEFEQDIELYARM
jgi:transitional endoplasmic reticulum ATPase